MHIHALLCKTYTDAERKMEKKIKTDIGFKRRPTNKLTPDHIGSEKPCWWKEMTNLNYAAHPRVVNWFDCNRRNTGTQGYENLELLLLSKLMACGQLTGLGPQPLLVQIRSFDNSYIAQLRDIA
ncbi:hypothetical protein F2P81_001671 [Scophthalmus maximus]|uniref:Uncharacterized protein n=1 Tax=Scophthalmus maximus TaxID=52904 RepID=A0A6A4TSU5_SCOMX|nr:hypothetical protein F2P81_001671 [Scophthalmus maximus]